MLDQLIERLYRRTRTHYYEALVAIFAAWLLLFVVPLYCVIGGSLLRGVGRDWVVFIAASELATAVATPIVAWLSWPRHAPAMRWLRREPGATPQAAWAACTANLPGTIVRGAVVYWLSTIPIVVGVGRRFDLTAFGSLAWSFAMAVFVASGALFAYLMFERALLPVVREVAAELPPDAELTPGGLSLRARLLAMLVLISMFSASTVALVTTRSTDSLTLEQTLAAMLAVAAAFTAILALPLSRMGRDSVLVRVEALRAAMAVVDRGEYGARVLPLGGDELDELGRNFNQMVERLQRHDEEMRESRARIVTASDAARRRVERDLHDGAQQHLVTLRLRLGMAQRCVEPGSSAAALLDEARADVDHALDELRDLAHGIYPATLTNDGLVAALEVAAERCSLPTTIESTGGESRLAPDVEAAAYFCCVEALQNASKHAGRDARVVIRLDFADAALRFEVRDDGAGYDPATLAPSGGLQNMADRIGAAGGSLWVHTEADRGVSVVGVLPRPSGWS